MNRETVLEAAIKYATKLKWSVIPLRQDKRPYTKWEQYQKKEASLEQIKIWWGQYPDAMIGIVTGSISNISVIDIDDQYGKKAIMDLLPNRFAAPTVITPRGGMHLYVKYCKELRNATSILPGVDIRSEGGYVAVPPSLSYGVPYAWASLRTPDKLAIPELPDVLYQALTRGVPLNVKFPPPEDLFTQGRRDNDLFHTAHCMVKGGLEPGIILEALTRIAKTCSPPFPEKDVVTKVSSAFERALRKDRNLSQEVQDYIGSTTGSFRITDISRILQLSTLQDRKNLYVILHRLVEDAVIERAGYQDGVFRRIERSCDELAISPGRPTPLDLNFPFGLEKLVHLYPGNIVVIAGSQNAGKTSFMLDFIKRNMAKFPINYYSSEMGAEEFNLRLSLHEEVKEWTFKAFERSNNFADVIDADSINIIDYLEVTEEFWKVGTVLRQVHDKLDKGIALIALQKDPEKLLGRGSSFGLEKPRLYLALNQNRLEIVKAKNWASLADNPNGKSIGFKLLRGTKFLPERTWMRRS